MNPDSARTLERRVTCAADVDEDADRGRATGRIQ